MSALAQPELDGGFSGLTLVKPLVEEQELPVTRTQLASWLVGMASGVNVIVSHMYGDRDFQYGTDNLGDWVSLPVNEDSDPSKSTRWYRALRASDAVMRVIDSNTQLPDSMLTIPAIAEQDNTTLGDTSTINARYTEYEHNWLPNANVARYTLRWSEIDEDTRKLLSSPFTERVDMGIVPSLLQRLDTKYYSVNPFLKSGEKPDAKGITPVVAYVAAVEAHVTQIAIIGSELGSVAAQALVKRFNIV